MNLDEWSRYGDYQYLLIRCVKSKTQTFEVLKL